MFPTHNVSLSDTFFTGNLLASDPHVYRDGNTYVMLYTDLDPLTQNTIISMARSQDGKSWSLANTAQSSPGALLMGSDIGIENLETAATFSVGGASMIMASGILTM